MSSYNLSHLKQLEHEAIFVLREVAAQFERPVLLFSGGKDSIVMVQLAQRAFYPAAIPFPLLHIDTGHNFSETIEYRDWLVEKVGARLLVRKVQDSIDKGRVAEEKGVNPSRNGLQTVTLLDAIEELRADAAIGGGRRDEEKARAKERFFSHRDEFGQWDPKNQRPELWNIFNGRLHQGENFRVFPLSNWTEMDVWQYILQEKIEMPSLYFSHEREVVDRRGMLLANTAFNTLLPGEKYEKRIVRFRTVGDATCTGAVLSPASNLEEIIAEVAAARQTERGTRADDKRSENAMEGPQKSGVFLILDRRNMKDMNGDAEAAQGINDPLTQKIIGCAIKIHRVLGPGFLENIYHQALAHELNKARVEYISEARMKVLYDGIVLGDYVADFLVEKRVVVELKAVEVLNKAHEIQLVNYLTAIHFDVGLLINFGGQKIQVKRKVRELNRPNPDSI